MRLMTNHLCTNFYHEISGNAMVMWRYHIRDFWCAIWDHLPSGATHQETTFEPEVADPQYIFRSIPFKSFVFLGFWMTLASAQCPGNCYTMNTWAFSHISTIILQVHDSVLFSLFIIECTT
jgi:hypothetical protein